MAATVEKSNGVARPQTRSFRDPHGAVFSSGDRIFRIVNAEGEAELQAGLSSAATAKWVEAGSLVQTARLGAAESRAVLADPECAGLYDRIQGQAILEHERIPFASFPYEWPPEMLHAAASLTLDLALDLLPEGLGLKDATPYNVLFRGPKPVFVDVLSLERRQAGDPAWLPYAQFVRTFLLPLLANRHIGLSLDQLLFNRRDGLEPEQVYRWLSPGQRIRPPFLSLVSMPVWLAKRHQPHDASLYERKLLPDAEKARFIFRSLLESLRRCTRRLAPKRTVSSAWTGYMGATGNNYSNGQFASKERFVSECIETHRPRRVLDVGCNTGHFSLLAARNGARVVAIDSDPAVVGSVWRQAAAEDLDVLPLVVNLTNPTPGTGWNNREWPSFLERAQGSFDAVFMLAVIHHMLVTERVPLDGLVDLAASLTSDLLVIEYVAPEDSMFRRLARGREELHRGLTQASFESSFRRRFDLLQSRRVEDATRWLYLMRRKSA